MPKRKSDSDCDRIERKIRKLEKKLARKRRRRRHSASSVSDSLSPHLEQLLSEPEDNEARSHRMLTDDNDLIDQSIEPGPSCQEPPVKSVIVTPPEMAQPSTSTAEPVGSAEQPETDPVILDDDLLDILGHDPTTDKKYGKDIHKDLAIRFQHWATVGLDKDLRKVLRDRYLTPDNCKLIDPPILNAEMKAAITDNNVKKDKAIEGKQKTLTSAISCLGEAITLLMLSKDKDTTLLKLLMDSTRIICDAQHADTITRRKFVMGGLKQEIKEQLQNSKVDMFLFGENLAETLKSAKAISKTSTDLKLPTSKAPIRKQMATTASSNYVTRHLNWQNPGPARRQLDPPRMKQPAPTPMHNRQFRFLRQSQHLPQRPGNIRR